MILGIGTDLANIDRIEPVHPAGWCGPAGRPGVPRDSVGLGRGAGKYR